MGKLTSFSIGRRDLQKENHWEPLDINTYRITKPTVFCFGGNFTKTPQDANAMCKLAQNLVGLKDKTSKNEIATSEDVDFVGIEYGKNSDDKFVPSSLTAQERSLIIKKIFTPLYQDENGNILPNNQIMKNFNQVTFFSWCHGATEISQICLESFKQMQEIGISEDVAEKAFGQMFSVSYSPNNITAVPSLRIFSEEDKMRVIGATSEDISSEYMFNLTEKVYPKSPHNGIYKANKDTAVLITSHIIQPKRTIVDGKKSLSFKDEHSAFLIDRNENWEPVEEGISSYGDKTSQVAGYALANSIANSIQNQSSEALIPKPTIDEIIVDARDILGETQKSDFYEIIKNIKESHGEKTEDIPEEPTTQEPN